MSERARSGRGRGACLHVAHREHMVQLPLPLLQLRVQVRSVARKLAGRQPAQPRANATKGQHLQRLVRAAQSQQQQHRQHPAPVPTQPLRSLVVVGHSGPQRHHQNCKRRMRRGGRRRQQAQGDSDAAAPQCDMFMRLSGFPGPVWDGPHAGRFWARLSWRAQALNAPACQLPHLQHAVRYDCIPEQVGLCRSSVLRSLS